MRKLAVSIAAAALGFVPPAVAQTLVYSTGFEQGYVPGPLSGQGGWTVVNISSGADESSDVVVQGAYAYAGDQAVEFTQPVGSTAAYHTFTPFIPAGPITVSARINYQFDAIDSQFLVDSAPGSEDITAGIAFLGTGGLAGGPVELVAFSSQTTEPEIGVVLGEFAATTWLDVSMTLNYATQTYDVSVNGSQVGSNIAFCGVAVFDNDCTAASVTPFSEIDFRPHGPKSGVLYLDDVSVTEVPEPGAWSLMIAGVGLVGASLRWRRARRFRPV
ncbi:MAG TPA: PEPxxWA-CTERM sorting domain-containing protein [Caulobacteraceae bacterium]|jgi:hypothetical protein|nr:PEPxxWA-CTERM sorting domain-containing protein [Caulobacteraceae bacterium]